MMKILRCASFLLLFGFLFGCAEDEDSSVTEALLTGSYQGTFERNEVSSNVMLILFDNEFSGSSDQLQFPTICKGSYALEGSTLTFQDECFYNGLFDHTLILAGDWEVSFEGDRLIMSGGERGIYRLTKE